MNNTRTCSICSQQVKRNDYYKHLAREHDYRILAPSDISSDNIDTLLAILIIGILLMINIMI